MLYLVRKVKQSVEKVKPLQATASLKGLKNRAAIFAPFTVEQIEGLNRWQNAGYVHEFTCPTNHVGSRTLVATEDGWHCPSCDYRQNWAHDFMAAGPPLEHLQEPD